MAKASKGTLRDEAALRDFAMKYPQVHEDFPWGHRAIKVNKKAFTFIVADENGLSMSVKLPESNGAALMLPFAEPTGYGMAKSGWVTCQFKPSERAPIEILEKFLDESYRAVAPKKLVKLLDGGLAPAPAAKNTTAAKPKPRGGKRTADRAGTAARGKSKRAVSARRG